MLISMPQWLPESTAPGFRQAVETYLNDVQALSDSFAVLIAEALDIEPTVFTRLLEKTRFSLIRIAAYPRPGETGSQGVGPHKDGSFLTFLLQGTTHSCLEVQNKAGEWISTPPIPNTLVVNIGRSLETLTQGLCVATTHRVTLQPGQYCQEGTEASSGLRLSFPFFQSLGLDVSREDMQVELPNHILSLRRDDDMSEVEAYFAEAFRGPVGEALIANGITSYPEVGVRWYPHLYEEILKQQHAAKELDNSRDTGKA